MSSPALALENVKIHLKWMHQFQSAGYIVALEKGYYKDAGFQVELIEGTSDKDPIQALVEGAVQYAVADTGVLLYKNEGFPVVVLANIFQHSAMELITPQAINKLAELRGQAVMISKIRIELIAMLKKAGIDYNNKEVIQQDTGSIDDLLSGKTSAWPSYISNEPFLLRKRAFAFHEFHPQDYGVDFYGDMLITTSSELDFHPDRVERVLQATLRGWNEALKHPDQAIDTILKKYNSQHKSREHLAFEARKISRLMHSDMVQIGYINPDRWQSIVRTYQTFGLLPKDFSLYGFLYHKKIVLQDVLETSAWKICVFFLILLVIFLTLHWIMQRSAILRSTGKLLKEIEERKYMEVKLIDAKQQAEQALTAKSEFLSVMSHELRTPLHGMIGLLDLMRSGIHPEQRQDFSLVQQSAQSLQALVNDILDLSKVEAGKLRLKNSPVHIKDCLIDVLRTFVVAVKHKDITLTAEMQAVPMVILGDEVRIRQVLVNLVGNAVKFTEKGGVHIHIKGLQKLDKTWLDIRVKDTGIGISKEDIDTIFEPFTQVSNLMQSQHSGTGLGTTIAKRLVQEMLGDIRIESKLGEGSTFNFRFPCSYDSDVISCSLDAANAGDVLIEARTNFEKSVQNHLQCCKVLLAEDDPISQRIALKRLKKSGVEADLAKDGREAWRLFQQQSYDLILLDLRMPGIDGLVLTKKIRQYEKEKNKPRTYIIGLSAHALEDVQQTCLDAGMDTFLSKPIEPQKMMQYIMGTLQKS
ncbi:MAG: ABC transporter substrate-binding protein [Mariprofundaceae bacterium]|nr:ABC transporter substrate-binding protein [Mariprofundaceae bacterium]